MGHHHGHGEIVDMTPEERRKDFLRNLLTLVLAVVIVVLSFFLLNPWSQSVIDQARDERHSTEGSVSEAYYKGVVERINFENTVQEDFSGVEMLQQNLTAQLTEGPEKGKQVEITANFLDEKSVLESGNTIVIREETQPEGEKNYTFVDFYRMDRVAIFAGIFVLLVVALSGFKGLGSFFSLLFSIIILVQFLLPQMILGTNLFWMTFLSSLFIVLISIYLSHGFNRRSTVAIGSIMLTIIISALISTWAVGFTRLTGLGSDDAFFLASNQMNSFLDIQGVLLAGIIIGTIGVLDDVTITQSATVYELSKANPNLSSLQLFWRAMNVGREHVVSMVNTLAMAYAGGALPLLLLLTLGNGNPLWVSLNNELIVEEIVRTIAGSIGLLLAVPITTGIASKFLKKQAKSGQDNDHHQHDHDDNEAETPDTSDIQQENKPSNQKPKKTKIHLG